MIAGSEVFAVGTNYYVTPTYQRPALLAIPDIVRRVPNAFDSFDEKAFGGFEINIPDIHPAIWTQLYNPTAGGVLFFPTVPVDAQVVCTVNQTTNANAVSFDAGSQTVVHPTTGRTASRVSIAGSLLAIRWHFADPNGDGVGIWYAVPNMSMLL